MKWALNAKKYYVIIKNGKVYYLTRQSEMAGLKPQRSAPGQQKIQVIVLRNIPKNNDEEKKQRMKNEEKRSKAEKARLAALIRQKEKDEEEKRRQEAIRSGRPRRVHLHADWTAPLSSPGSSILGLTTW